MLELHKCHKYGLENESYIFVASFLICGQNRNYFGQNIKKEDKYKMRWVIVCVLVVHILIFKLIFFPSSSSSCIQFINLMTFIYSLFQELWASRWFTFIYCPWIVTSHRLDYTSNPLFCYLRSYQNDFLTHCF